MRKDDYQIHHIDWQGITIEIRWNPQSPNGNYDE